MPEAAGSHAPGTPCWIDLLVPGRQAALDFYREPFGWQGEVVAAPFDMVADRMAVVRDPQGAMFALLDPAPMNPPDPAATTPEFRPGGERL